jgi:glycosyltransferase involved in cell wall biosynthesis
MQKLKTMERPLGAAINRMSQPRISIVIPTYNAAGYISQCLSSIQKQNYPATEVIVIDGGSNDDTLDIVGRYSYLNIIIKSEKDSGQPEAVTKGLRMATGVIDHWHAADDILLPGALHRVASAFSSDPDLGLVFSDSIAFDANRVFAGAYTRFIEFWPCLLFFGRFQSDCAYWRHSITPSALPLDNGKPLNCDEDFFLRVWAGRPHKWISKPLGAFRMRKDQLSAQLSKNNLEADRADSRRRVCEMMGISREKADELRKKYWWSYVLGSRIAPQTYSAARFVIRKLTFDIERRRYTRWFLNEWLGEGK